jgi:hypothetical protein
MSRACRSPRLAGPDPAALLVAFHSRAPAGGEALNARRPESQIRVTRVEPAAAPFDHAGVILVARVEYRLEKLEIAVWAADVLGRTAPVAGDEPGVESARDALLDGLYRDVVPPAIAEVVSVTKASVAFGDQSLEFDVAGGTAPRGRNQSPDRECRIGGRRPRTRRDGNPASRTRPG